jgi:hypothetical protein
MRHRATLLSLALFVILAGAQVARAKGASSARITGPGLDAPIRMEVGEGRAIYRLANMTGIFSAVFDARPYPTLDRPPVKDLGPRYDVAYVFDAENGRPDVVHQDLYPYARGGPLAYVAPGQRVFRGKSIGGWLRARSSLLPFLASKGFPDRKGRAPQRERTGDAGPATPASPATDEGDDAAVAPARPPVSSPESGTPWAGVAAGLLVLMVLGVVAQRRRLRSARA